MATIDKAERELTALEYVILGFLAAAPQSGYSLINRVENGRYRWSASAGSIYPVLKRLEQSGLVGSHLEAEYETRPRRVYSLLPAGAVLIDDWLRRPPQLREVIEEYDIALHKFLIAEIRLSRAEVLDWLEQYALLVRGAAHVQTEVSAHMDALSSPHEVLVNRSLMLEIEARRQWIEEALARLSE